MNRTDSFLIDTDIIIYWLTNKYPQIDEKIREVGDDNIFVSSITIAELYFGAYNSSKVDENLELVSELLTEINVLDFHIEAGEKFGKIKSELKKSGESLSDSDLFIASTALSEGAIPVTNNEKHFKRIKNLSIQNWTKGNILPT